MAIRESFITHSALAAARPQTVSKAPRRTLRSLTSAVARTWRLSMWRRRATGRAESFSSIPYDVLKDLYVVRYGAINNAINNAV